MQTAIIYRESKAKASKEKESDESKITLKPCIIWDVGSWKRPKYKTQSVDGSTKFLKRHDGPYVVIRKNTHTARLQDLRTGRLQYTPIPLQQECNKNVLRT